MRVVVPRERERERTVLTSLSSSQAMNLSAFDVPIASDALASIDTHGRAFFLSINRYERKKNHALAIEAFASLETRLPRQRFESLQLVIAGGYDERVVENVEHAAELEALAKSHGVQDRVTFLRSVNEMQKLSLLANCIGVIYTPANEHFGIVPVEAMYMRKVR